MNVVLAEPAPEPPPSGRPAAAEARAAASALIGLRRAACPPRLFPTSLPAFGDLAGARRKCPSNHGRSKSRASRRRSCRRCRWSPRRRWRLRRRRRRSVRRSARAPPRRGRGSHKASRPLFQVVARAVWRFSEIAGQEQRILGESADRGLRGRPGCDKAELAVAIRVAEPTFAHVAGLVTGLVRHESRSAGSAPRGSPMTELNSLCMTHRAGRHAAATSPGRITEPVPMLSYVRELALEARTTRSPCPDDHARCRSSRPGCTRSSLMTRAEHADAPCASGRNSPRTRRCGTDPSQPWSASPRSPERLICIRAASRLIREIS